MPKHGVVVGLVVSKRRLAEPLCPFLFETVGRVGSFVHGVGAGVDGGGAVITGGTVLVGVSLVSGMVTGVSIGRHVECDRKVLGDNKGGFGKQSKYNRGCTCRVILGQQSMSLLRNPFVIPLFVALVACLVGLIAAVAITFSDINDAALPSSIWGRAHSYEFREFLRRQTSGVVSSIDKRLEGSILGMDEAAAGGEAAVYSPPSVPSPPVYTPYTPYTPY